MAEDDRPVGFVLLPLARMAREGKLAGWSDKGIAVLPVIVAHENAVTRLAWPSVARVAALAGVGKEAAREAVHSLECGGWLARVVRPGGGGAWKMTYLRYRPGAASGDWIRLGQDMVLRGAWAAFPPSAKRLYLILRGLSLLGHRATGTWIPNHEFDPNDLEANAFLPAQALDPGGLQELTGLNSRTLRHARAWLLENGMMLPSDEWEAPGMILPFEPGRYSPAVLDRVGRLRDETNNRPKGGALKAYRALRKAANAAASNSRMLRNKRQTQASQAANLGLTSGKPRPGTMLEPVFKNPKNQQG